MSRTRMVRKLMAGGLLPGFLAARLPRGEAVDGGSGAPAAPTAGPASRLAGYDSSDELSVMLYGDLAQVLSARIGPPVAGSRTSRVRARRAVTAASRRAAARRDRRGPCPTTTR